MSEKELSAASLWTQDVFLADFHKYGVRADLTDLVPGNDKLLIRHEQPAETERSGNNDGADAAFFLVKDQVIDPAEPLAAAAVYDILFFQFTEAHVFHRVLFPLIYA